MTIYLAKHDAEVEEYFADIQPSEESALKHG
jgi:hypothetical protein